MYMTPTTMWLLFDISLLHNLCPYLSHYIPYRCQITHVGYNNIWFDQNAAMFKNECKPKYLQSKSTPIFSILEKSRFSISNMGIVRK